MLWFEGSVSEAITESKRIKSLFVVYIKGDDDETDESKKMDLVWNNEQVNAVCSRDCTAIKLSVNSLDGKQFALLYPVVCIPCTYFIDGSGIPLEVIGGSRSSEQFLDKIKQTIQIHRTNFPKVEPESLPSSSSSQPTVSSQSDVPVGERNDSESQLTDRVGKAKKLIEDKRKEREEKEKEDARRKEIERRKEGQQTSKVKSEREGNLVQQMAERVRQEKAKNKAARDAIREKIAQDKAERAARQEIEKEERRNVAARIDPRLNANDLSVRCSNGNIRLQFRLPDGSSVTQNFPPDAVLETARQFICSKINFKEGVTFWTTFPRRHFGEDDFPKTLVELGLAPSAALIVDPSLSNSSSRSGDSSVSSYLSSVISLFLAPFLALLSLLRLFFFASPQPPRGAIPETSKQSTNTTNASASSSPTSDVRRRPKGTDKDEESFKKEGKVHSFRQDDNDDDENNTYNGNSTEQM